MNNVYLLSKNHNDKFKNSEQLGSYYLHTHRIDSFIKKNETTYYCLLGKFHYIKDFSKTVSDIIKDVTALNSVEAILDYTKYLIGKFVLITIKDEDVKVYGDAVSSIPIYYNTKGETIVSSHAAIIASMNSYRPSKTALDIQSKKLEQQQPFPYNLTLYEEVKTLLPNHYYDNSGHQAIRFYPNNKLKSDKSYPEIIAETRSIVQEYVDTLYKSQEVLIPITSGIDSRLVLSFFKNHRKNITMYTFYNENNTEDEDNRVPKIISEKFNLKHLSLKRQPLHPKSFKIVKQILPFEANERILSNANSLYLNNLNHIDFVSGDIVPIIKSNFGKALPEKLATLNYLTVKSHNYSSMNKNVIQEWIDDVDEASKRSLVSKFDLFFWESRLGQWQQKNYMNYDLFASHNLIFNCRYLLELWLSIERSERMKTSLHYELIKINWPELLELPFNPDKSFVEFITNNDYVYYVGSYLKYIKNYFL